MARLANWRSRLGQLLDEKESSEFKYGVNDCCTFAADIVLALTGHDPASEWRGRYSTPLGGIRHLRKAGYTDQFEFLARNYPETPRAMAAVGDLAIVNDDTLVVIAGPFVLGLGEKGLVRLPISDVTRAFAVRGAV